MKLIRKLKLKHRIRAQVLFDTGLFSKSGIDSGLCYAEYLISRKRWCLDEKELRWQPRNPILRELKNGWTRDWKEIPVMDLAENNESIKNAYIACFGEFNEEGCIERYCGQFLSISEFAQEHYADHRLADKLNSPDDINWPDYEDKIMKNHVESNNHYFLKGLN